MYSKWCSGRFCAVPVPGRKSLISNDLRVAAEIRKQLRMHHGVNFVVRRPSSLSRFADCICDQTAATCDHALVQCQQERLKRRLKHNFRVGWAVFDRSSDRFTGLFRRRRCSARR
jgi:hypothetical protein